jgi:hypothetical protein
MRDFWAFFQLHPISDDVEDLAMKLFSATLHDDARRWYDGLPNASITSMDQLEEVFLRRWNVKEDPDMLLQRLMHIKKVENEAIKSSIPGSRSCHDNSLEPIVLDPNSSFSSISGHSQDNQNSCSIKRVQGQSKKLMTWPQKSKPTSPHPRKNNPLFQKSRLVSPKIPQIFLREYLSLRPLLKNS